MFWQQLMATLDEMVQAPAPYDISGFDRTREPLEWLFAEAAARTGLPITYHSKGKHPDYFTEGPMDLELKGMGTLSGAIQLNSTPPGAVHAGRYTLLLLFRARQLPHHQMQVTGAAVLHPGIFQCGSFATEESGSVTVNRLGGDPWVAVRVRMMFMIEQVPKLVDRVAVGRAVMVLPEAVDPGPGFEQITTLTKTEAPVIPGELRIRFDGSPAELTYVPNPNAGRTHRFPVWQRLAAS